MELEKSGEQGEAKQSKAMRAKRIESGITHRDEVVRQAEIGRLADGQAGRAGWAPTLQDRTGLDAGTGHLVGEVLKPK